MYQLLLSSILHLKTETKVSLIAFNILPEVICCSQTCNVIESEVIVGNTFDQVLLTLGAHARSKGYSSCCVCMCVCVSTHNCRLTHWNHKTGIPTNSLQYRDRFKFCRFS